jgi:hypothetical protein
VQFTVALNWLLAVNYGITKMKLDTKTVVDIEMDSNEACALIKLLNGFVDLRINEKDFFDMYSLGERELNRIKEISKKLNSISTIID